MLDRCELRPVLAHTDASVPITGETGTGMDMVTEASQNSSNRFRHPFITINCGALPEALLESELLGHVRGAFTGAGEDSTSYDNPFTIVFNFFVCTALFALIVALFMQTTLPTNREWLFIGGIALSASLGQFPMTLAYRCEIAPVVAASSYASIVLSVIYGYFFWNEIPHPLA
ncbi:MAG: sigma 54-interacting transcriptional regulator, partial [Desulfobulbaceae bacterium]|nr:sigma 54-interacting transcriptional regulator [Desulfobulbaceae bacterium]